MLINVNEIKDNDRLEFSVSDDKIENLEGPAFCKFIFGKSKNRLRIKGEISFKYKITCARCLDEVVKEFNQKVDSSFEKGNLPVAENETELKNDDFDRYYYTGEEFDISLMIRDTILLAIPIKPLCKPDCKGLCPYCGKNLNKGDCRCER